MKQEKSKNGKENLHSGHRKRLKEQMMSGGFGDATPPHLLLETLLFYSVPRRDTNPIAHRLLNTFGSLRNVLEAPKSELLKISGVTENTVSLFRMIGIINRRLSLEEAREYDSFDTFDEIGQYLVKQFVSLREEHVGILFLKATGRIIAFDFVGKGDITAVGVNTRKIVELAVKHDAAMAVLCHNHPSGVALPSVRDVEITKGLVSTLSNIGIRLIDHIIVAGNDFVSLAQSQEFSNIF